MDRHHLLALLSQSVYSGLGIFLHRRYTRWTGARDSQPSQGHSETADLADQGFTSSPTSLPPRCSREGWWRNQAPSLTTVSLQRGSPRYQRSLLKRTAH